MSRGPRIGLALSGGGYRATAFGLGALRALHDRDLLRRVTVVSGISGGGLLAAMWAYGPCDFDDFDATVTALLATDLQKALVRQAIMPGHIAKELGSATNPVRRLLGQQPQRYSRTDLMVDAFRDRVFGAKEMGNVTHAGLDTVLTATDMTTSSALRFGSVGSSLWRYGRITRPVRVAEAVAASAAFPILLPPLQRTYEFEQRNGKLHSQTVDLTDGGVFDNLGLTTLLPGRDPTLTDHVYEVDYIIAIDAARGRTTKRTRTLTPFRLARAFDITYNKTQDGSRARLNAAAEHGELTGFVHAYLSTPDRKLPSPVADLVPLAGVNDYPTNFAAMSPENMRLITTRGEQLTRILLARYCPQLA